MEKSLKNKVVLITGSSSGIGRETAFAFAKEGCKVVVTYNKGRGEALAASKKALELGAPDSLAVHLNVMDDGNIRDAVRAVVSKFGTIDILVNNAGVGFWKTLRDTSDDDIALEIGTNLAGLIKMTRECLPHVKDTIINIASRAGIEAYGEMSVYCATKFGVRGFTQALGKELKGIGVYAVNPTMTATRMTDYEGMPPEKVAEVVVNTAKGKYKVPQGGDILVWEVVK